MDSLQDSLKIFPGLRFFADSLELSSAPAKRLLLATTWSSDYNQVSERLEEIEEVIVLLQDAVKGNTIRDVAEYLCHLRISVGSIDTLASGATCSDVDFFELKGLALLERRISTILEEAGIHLVEMPSLEKVLDFLDPEGNRLESFFLSDRYSEELARLRRLQEKAEDEEERTRIAHQAALEEERVRRQISKRLAPYAGDLLTAYNALAKDDLLIAKARWAVKYNAAKPIPISEGESELTDLWNPEIRDFLQQRGEHFQPVSINFGTKPTLITGANMAGKSVLLSSIALAQLLMQYGFYIPARTARLRVIDEVMISFNDGQDTAKGLSSFGAEILRLNEMVSMVKTGKLPLLLIDEAARTTNPEEGRAIVEALVRIFGKYPSQAIITTHYNGIKAEVKRYRVRGFIEEKAHCTLEVCHLNKCMDYSLIPTEEDDTPQEAIRIAEMLGIDEELLQFSRESFVSMKKLKDEVRS